MSISSEEIIGSLKKNPISVGCTVVAIALLGLMYFRSGKAAELETELEQKSALAAKLALNLKNSAQLKEQFDALVEAEKEIESRMIRAGDLTTNRQYFYNLEAETGVKIMDGSLRQTMGTKKDAKAAFFPTAFSVTVQGDYRQLLTFLQRVEKGARYSRVLSVVCNSSPDRGSVLLLSVNLELLGFP